MTQCDDIEDRLKMLVLRQGFVFALVREAFTEIDAHGSRTMQVSTSGIPADAEWLDVHYDSVRHAFVFTIRHPSFEPVPECYEIPRISTLLSRHELVLTQEQIQQIRLLMK